MNLRTYYLEEIEPAIWQRVFVFCLHHADSFVVRFFTKKEKTDECFEDFFGLPDITVSNWLGEKDGIQITGELTEEVRQIFYRLQEPAFNGEVPRLWDGKLLKQGREIISIENHTERLIHLTEQEIALLATRGIDISNWEGVAMAVVEGHEHEAIDWSEEELRVVAGLISHWLSGDKKH